MLVLTRRVGEAIIIGDDIKITVLTVEHMKARLGVNAPKNVIVHREKSLSQDLQTNQQTLEQEKDVS